MLFKKQNVEKVFGLDYGIVWGYACGYITFVEWRSKRDLEIERLFGNVVDLKGNS